MEKKEEFIFAGAPFENNILQIEARYLIHKALCFFQEGTHIA